MLSRVASTLYWMSRYVERAENTARVLDVTWRMSLLVKVGLPPKIWLPLAALLPQRMQFVRLKNEAFK